MTGQVDAASLASEIMRKKTRKKLMTSHAARKRKAFKRCIRLDADTPILAQVRNIGR